MPMLSATLKSVGAAGVLEAGIGLGVGVPVGQGVGVGGGGGVDDHGGVVITELEFAPSPVMFDALTAYTYDTPGCTVVSAYDVAGASTVARAARAGGWQDRGTWTARLTV